MADVGLGAADARDAEDEINATGKITDAEASASTSFREAEEIMDLLPRFRLDEGWRSVTVLAVAPCWNSPTLRAARLSEAAEPKRAQRHAMAKVRPTIWCAMGNVFAHVRSSSRTTA
jgi:hypothetical protein